MSEQFFSIDLSAGDFVLPSNTSTVRAQSAGTLRFAAPGAPDSAAVTRSVEPYEIVDNVGKVFQVGTTCAVGYLFVSSTTPLPRDEQEPDPGPINLAALTLSASSVAENVGSGIVIGALQNKTANSTLSLVNDAGGRVVLSGNNLLTGLVGFNYETATSHQVVVRETLAGASNSPRDTALTINVTNVAEITLSALTLSASTVAENAGASTAVGTVLNRTAGSTLTLIDNAGGRFALSGANLITGSTGFDFETAASHQITIRETIGDATNSPRDTTLTINVTNVVEITLAALTLSASTIAESASPGTVVGTIQNRTSGSSLSLVDDAGGRFALSSGSIVAGLVALDFETATSHNITIRETIGDATNSPRDTVLTITVTDVVEGPTTDSGVTAIRADGWSLDYTSPPTMQPETAPRVVALTRQGFDATGAAVTYAETLVLTQRVRQPYPNQATLDASRVAMSDYVYSTDTIIGGQVNNSAEASPKPIARWALPDRRMVGNSLRLQIVAAHRNARQREQIACVRFTATDGTNTVSAIVSQSSILNGVNDRQPVIGYGVDLDISTLAEGQITANAEVFPWIGGSASVRRSSDAAVNARDFAPQIYRKGASRTVLYAYVDAAGNDTSGVASSNATTASATPCATIAGAIAKIRAADGGTITDGHVVRLKAGSQSVGTVASVTHSSIAEVTIEADPAAGSTPTLTLPGTNWATRHAYMRFKDIIISRTGTTQIGGSLSPSYFTFENCTYANNSGNATPLSGQGVGRWLGCTITGSILGFLQPGTMTTAQHWLVRGTALDVESNVDCFCSLGNSWVNTAHIASVAAQEGGFVAFNKFSNQASRSAIVVGALGDVPGFACLQNLIEWTGAVDNVGIRASADSVTGNVTHLVFHHNTIASGYSYGRGNMLYNDSAAARTHKLCSFVGNIHTQLNTKHDVFCGISGGTQAIRDDAPNRVGGWAYMYGVGCRGEFSMFADAAGGAIGGSFAQAYPGPKASIGTLKVTRNDPLFVNYRGTTVAGTEATPTYSAGLGGGDYRLQASSPAISRVAEPVLRFDLAGNTRPTTNDAAGAYQPVA